MSSSTSASSATAAALNGKGEEQQKMMNVNTKKMKMKKSRGGGGGGGGRMRWSAEELIKQYEESEGMDTKQASIKVINDLQKALFRLITTSKKQQQQPQQQQHLDVIYSRLLRLDMKLDSKPGYPHILGLGLASAATYRTLETLAFPQLTSAFANIWNAVRSTTTTNSNPNN